MDAFSIRTPVCRPVVRQTLLPSRDVSKTTFQEFPIAPEWEDGAMSTAPDNGPASVRLDVWLWSVRIFKTRSEATTACRAGHVRLNGASAKAAQALRVGDTVTVRRPRA